MILDRIQNGHERLAAVHEGLVLWLRSIPAYWYVVSLAAVVGALSAVIAVLLTGEYLRSSSAVSVELEEVGDA